MEAIKKAWQGKEKLWKVFWIYNWILGTFMVIVQEQTPKLGAVVDIAWNAIVVVWAVWVAVSLWRCAFNAGSRAWGYIVRAILILSMLALALTIVGVA